MFLTGQIPKEETELQVIIKPGGGEKKKKKNEEDASTKITFSEVQHQKRKENIRDNILAEYGGILGQDKNSAEAKKLQSNKYYQQHLRAQELQRQDDFREKQDHKARVLQHAFDNFLYDDDFDEE